MGDLARLLYVIAARLAGIDVYELYGGARLIPADLPGKPLVVGYKNDDAPVVAITRKTVDRRKKSAVVLAHPPGKYVENKNVLGKRSGFVQHPLKPLTRDAAIVKHDNWFSVFAHSRSARKKIFLYYTPGICALEKIFPHYYDCMPDGAAFLKRS